MGDPARWRAATDVAAMLSEVGDGHQFLDVATIALREALQVDAVAYAEWHPVAAVVGLTVVVSDSPTDDGQAQTWAGHHREDLWIRHVGATRDPRVVVMSEYATRAQLSSSATYQGCYRPSGFSSMAHLALSLDPGTSAALGIGRSRRPLDDEDLALFEALRRSLASAYLRLRVHHTVGPAWPAGPALDRELVHLRPGAPLPGSIPTAARPVDAADLTPRQQQVLRLVAEGLTNQQIARRLGLSPHTVKKHLELIARRLGTANRAAASTRWMTGAMHEVPLALEG